MSDDSEQKYRKVSTKTTVHHYHPGASDPFDVAYKAEAENMRDRYGNSTSKTTSCSKPSANYETRTRNWNGSCSGSHR